MITLSPKDRKCCGLTGRGVVRSTLDKSKQSESKILSRFIEVYCRGHHFRNKGKGDRGRLCVECNDLLDYALHKLERCPYDPKPKCKACETHCYKPAYREKIREVMRYSGIHFVKRGRLDWLIRYFLV